MNIFYEILLASVLPTTYLYSQMFLQIDKGTFSMVFICVGEIFLAIIINNKEKQKKKIYKQLLT